MFDQYGNKTELPISTMEFNEMKRIHHKWPSLERLIQESKRIKQELYIESLLRPVSSLEFESDSDISEISDVFEEFHKESYLKRQNGPKKYLTKHEADVETMEQFTDDFKNTMAKMREELKISDDMYLEKLEDIEKDQISNKDKNREAHKICFKELVEELVDSEKLPCKSTSESPNDRKDSVGSSESGIWKVLGAYSDPKKFQITPPGYNAFEDQKHWLERPLVPLEQIDASKVKCEKWLEQL